MKNRQRLRRNREIEGGILRDATKGGENNRERDRERCRERERKERKK